MRILTEYGRLTLAEDTTAIQKLVLAESDRFPELAADFYRGAVIATQRVFVRLLERLCREGAIEIDDLDEAAGMLRGMMIFEPSRGAMFGQKALPCIAEIEARAARCARLFLDGCRKGKTGVRRRRDNPAGDVRRRRASPDRDIGKPPPSGRIVIARSAATKQSKERRAPTFRCCDRSR